MKRLLLCLLISTFTFSSLTAMVKEFRFRVYRVINGIEQLEGGVPISIFGFNAQSRSTSYDFTSSGSTYSTGAYESGTCNASCDIVDVNGPISGRSYTPNITPELPVADYYIIVIGSR